jgi:predicted Zn-dependent peptidase
MLDRSIAPKTRTFEHLTIPPQVVEEMPGGVTLHIVDNGSLPVNRVCVMWNYGTAMGAMNGSRTIAEYVPELMREGSKTIDGATLAETIDFNGAWLRSRSTDHHAYIDLISLNHTTAKLLDLLTDIFNNASLPENAFDALHTKAVRRRQIELSKVSTLAEEAVAKLMFGAKHPYLNAESVEQIASVTYQDVVKAYELGTQHSKIDVYIGGRIDEQTLQTIRNFCRNLRPNLSNACEYKLVDMTPEAAQWQRIEVESSLQNALAAGIPAIKRDHPDYVNLRLVVIALGGYFGSRLMSNIREEKGLTYGISSALMGMREGAHTQINAQYATGNSQQVIDEVRNELRQLATEPMGNDELTRLKRFVTTNLAATLDSPFAIMDYYQNQVIVGTPSDYFATQFACINALNAETIMRIATQYLNPDDMRIVTAGGLV